MATKKNVIAGRGERVPVLERMVRAAVELAEQHNRKDLEKHLDEVLMKSLMRDLRALRPGIQCQEPVFIFRKIKAMYLATHEVGRSLCGLPPSGQAMVKELPKRKALPLKSAYK